jgi:hypothetical protein
VTAEKSKARRYLANGELQPKRNEPAPAQLPDRAVHKDQDLGLKLETLAHIQNGASTRIDGGRKINGRKLENSSGTRTTELDCSIEIQQDYTESAEVTALPPLFDWK